MIQTYLADAQARLAQADRERRALMAQFIALPYSILMLLGIVGRIVVFVTTPNVSSVSFAVVNTVALTVVTALFIWAFVAARRGNPTRAALLVSLGGLGAPLIYIAQVIFETNLTFAIVIVAGALINAIMVAGIIGSVRLTAIVTGLGIAIAFLVFIVLPKPGILTATVDASHQSVLFITATLEYVAAFLIMWAGARGYARVQQRLTSAEMQVAFAQQIDQAKNLFIANVNHELRNPVMALQLAQMSLLRLFRSLPPEQVEGLIRNELGITERLNDLVSSILEASGVGKQRMEVKPLDLATAIHQAAELVPSPDVRDIHLALPPDLTVLADAIALRQIMTNLLSNALKYSPQDQPVEITATTADGWVAVRVRDYGLGIPAEQVPMLFQQFVRLPRDIESPVTGNGVGLYMCRVLTEALGGTIGVESSGIEGAGSTFIVQLPVATASVAVARA